MNRTRIAVLISMLLAVPAGVYALDQAASTETSAEAPAPTQEIVATDQTTVVAEPVAVVNEPNATTIVAEPVAVERTITVAPVPARAPSYTMASLQDARSTFPQGSYDSEYLKAGTPRQAAWLEQRDEQRQAMIASLGKGFPDGSANSEMTTAPLPAQVAYFNRVEEQRMAAMQPQPVAQAESSAQAGSSEVAMANTSAIR